MENIINNFQDNKWLNINNKLIKRELSIDNTINGVVTFNHMIENTSFVYNKQLNNIFKNKNYIITLWAKTTDNKWRICIELEDNKNNKIKTEKKYVSNTNTWINLIWNINDFPLSNICKFTILCESFNRKTSHSLYDPIFFEYKDYKSLDNKKKKPSDNKKKKPSEKKMYPLI